MTQKVEPAGRYFLFFSYRHQNPGRKWAMRLQRDIEALHPQRFDCRETRFRCFRDEDELAASSDLSEAIREALGEADHFVVMWTSTTRQSAWVMSEVVQYAARGAGQLLALPIGLAAADVRAALPAAAEAKARVLGPVASDVARGTSRAALAEILGACLQRDTSEIADALHDIDVVARRRRLLAASLVTIVIAALGLFALLQARQARAAERRLTNARVEADGQRDALYAVMDALIVEAVQRRPEPERVGELHVAKVREAVGLLPEAQPVAEDAVRTLDVAYLRKLGDVLGLVDARDEAAKAYGQAVETARLIRDPTLRDCREHAACLTRLADLELPVTTRDSCLAGGGLVLGPPLERPKDGSIARRYRAEPLIVHPVAQCTTFAARFDLDHLDSAVLLLEEADQVLSRAPLAEEHAESRTRLDRAFLAAKLAELHYHAAREAPAREACDRSDGFLRGLRGGSERDSGTARERTLIARKNTSLRMFLDRSTGRGSAAWRRTQELRATAQEVDGPWELKQQLREDAWNSFADGMDALQGRQTESPVVERDRDLRRLRVARREELRTARRDATWRDSFLFRPHYWSDRGYWGPSEMWDNLLRPRGPDQPTPLETPSSRREALGDPSLLRLYRRDLWEQVRVGMSPEEVIALFGVPIGLGSGAPLSSTRWSYDDASLQFDTAGRLQSWRPPRKYLDDVLGTRAD